MAVSATVSLSDKPDTSISATPRSTLMDQVVTIEVNGLLPKKAVTLRSYFNDEGKQFESHAHYTSNDEGNVNTTTQPSEGGHYTGVEPMGLFWSMTACPNHRHGTRYMKNDVSKPLVMNITVHKGHLDNTTCRQDTTDCIASSTVERWYMSEDVEKIEVRQGRVRGSLMKPKGLGPFPAIIDMFGGVRPGCNEIRAALLANKGYAVLALAYFGAEGQPSFLDKVDALDMEYFEEAADWLSNLQFIQPGGIATIGICKGGEMALAMAIHFPEKIRATVAISTASTSSVCPTSYKGERYPCYDYDFYHVLTHEEKMAVIAKMSFAADGAIILKDLKVIEEGDSDEKYLQKFENIRCPTLVICGDEDSSVNNQNSRIIAEKIRTNGHSNPCELIIYPGAGHLIEPPQAPVSATSFQPPWGLIEWGGNPADHARAQEKAWEKLLVFLENNLRAIDGVHIPTSKL